MLNKNRIWKWIKEIFSFLSSLYTVALLLGIIASIIPQILPIFFNPLIVEGAKYVMVILICFLGSYFLFRNLEGKIDKSIIAPLGKKIDAIIERTESKIEELNRKNEKSLAELDKKIIEFTNFIANQKQEHTRIDGKFSWIYGVKCPICNKWIDLNLPNTLISGVHVADGQPSNRTVRGTFEMAIQRSQCRNQLHIDVPHSNLFKVKTEPQT